MFIIKVHTYILNEVVGGIKVRKYLKNILLSGYGILFMIVIVIFLTIYLYLSYTRPINIQYKYSGIKYQAGNLQSAEPINVEIKGKFVRELSGSYGEFIGTVKVGELIFADKPIGFNKYKMGTLYSGEKQYGMIFIGDKFEKLTIEIDEPTDYGYSWSAKNGWMISAPCNDRKKAVVISNLLEQKLHKDLIIK